MSGVRRDPGRGAALPRGGVAERQAQVREVGEGPAPEPLRRIRGRGRPPRALAARDPDGRLRRPRGERGGRPRRRRPSAGSAGRTGSSCRPGSSSSPRTTEYGLLDMSDRMRRVNEAVRAVVAEALVDLKDPRIGMVTVTGVRCRAICARARSTSPCSETSASRRPRSRAWSPRTLSAGLRGARAQAQKDSAPLI